MLLQPGDVPAPLEPIVDWVMPPDWITDPPECGEQLNANGPGDLKTGRGFLDPEGFLVYDSLARYEHGVGEDLDAFREAMAGACAGPFDQVAEGHETTDHRFELLDDPEVGDDAFAVRTDFGYDIEGYPALGSGYMIYLRRGDVSVQVQIVTGELPTVGITGPEISLDEVEELARAIDERLVALEAARTGS